jgi:hypothetical protein
MSKSSFEYIIVFTKRSTKVDSPRGRFPRIPSTAESVLDSEFIACVPGAAQIISVSEHVRSIKFNGEVVTTSLRSTSCCDPILGVGDCPNAPGSPPFDFSPSLQTFDSSSAIGS